MRAMIDLALDRARQTKSSRVNPGMTSVLPAGAAPAFT